MSGASTENDYERSWYRDGSRAKLVRRMIMSGAGTKMGRERSWYGGGFRPELAPRRFMTGASGRSGLFKYLDVSDIEH